MHTGKILIFSVGICTAVVIMQRQCTHVIRIDYKMHCEVCIQKHKWVQNAVDIAKADIYMLKTSSTYARFPNHRFAAYLQVAYSVRVTRCACSHQHTADKNMCDY